MSLQIDEKDNGSSRGENNKSAQTAEQKAPQQNQAYEQQAPSSNHQSLMSNRRFRLNSHAEVLQNFNNTIQAALGNTGGSKPGDFNTHLFDSKQYGWHYSLLAVSLTVNTGSHGKQATFYTFILEGSNNAPPSMIQNVNGQEVMITRTAMDAWDGEVAAQIASVVARDCGVEHALNASAMVVGSEIDFSDVESVNNLLWNAESAISATIKNAFPSVVPAFNIKDHIDPTRKRIAAKFSNRNETTENVAGKPVRSNLSMQVVAVESGRNGNQLNSFMHNSTSMMLEVNGYVDLVYAPQPPTTNNYGQVQQNTQRFAPRVVITQVITGDQVPLEMETFFLGLATYFIVADNFNWAGPFLPQNRDEKHDIGVLGYRAPDLTNNEFVAIDTSSNTFGPEQAMQLIQALCYPKPLFSIDCEVAGPYTWLTDVLEEAVKGNARANELIIQALNNLTNGAFSRHHDGQPLVVSESNAIQLGSFVDGDSSRKVVKDIRDIDTLAVMDILGQQGSIRDIDRWEETHNNASIPLAMRLESREQILRNVTQSGFKQHGSANRLTFTNSLITALIGAVREAGYGMNPEGLQGSFSAQTQVGNTFVHNYLANAPVNGLVNQGQVSSTGPLRSTFNRYN